MIERWYNREHLSSKEIAQRLDKSERTIRRELKRGLTTILNTYLEEIEVYSADIANDKYLFNLKAKGKDLKIGSDIELVRRIESMIKEEKKSPEVVAKEHKNKNKEKRIAKHTPPEKSIEYRPKEANMRSEYGHWEGDLIIGKRKRGSVLLTFTERMTREEIIIKIKGKNNKYVVKAINGLERKYGKPFYSKFKTITFDNGVEFMDYKGIEQSCLKKGKEQKYIMHIHIVQEKEVVMKITIE